MPWLLGPLDVENLCGWATLLPLLLLAVREGTAAAATAAVEEAASAAASAEVGRCCSGGLADVFHPFSRPARACSFARRSSLSLSLNAASMLATLEEECDAGSTGAGAGGSSGRVCMHTQSRQSSSNESDERG